MEQHKEAVYVPVQAVIRVGVKPTVYVVKGKELEPRNVELGLDNNKMVRIISGLEPGEVVSLAPPLAQAAVEKTNLESPDELLSGPKTDTPEDADSIAPPSESPRINDKAMAPALPEEKRSRAGGFLFQMLDKNSDGKVSREEFPGPDEIFGRLDKDGDGFIIKSEVPNRPQGSNRPSDAGSPGTRSRFPGLGQIGRAHV